MSGADGSNETSTIHGYVFSLGGSALAGSAMGGPARIIPGGGGHFSLAADANFSGQTAINITKFVGFVPTIGSGAQVIYGCTNSSLAPAWLIYLNGSNLQIGVGDAGGGFTPTVVAAGLVSGVPHSAAFTWNQGTAKMRVYFDGVFVAEIAVGGGPGAGSLTGWAGGESPTPNQFQGAIVAPTGWTRILSDAEITLMHNGGSPWRL